MSALSYFNEPAPLAWDVAAAIFGSTGEGGLYDPSALDTIFQDANGTTPAVPGSPVGLVLDARQELGPELVSNGDFASPDVWSLTDATISGGSLNVNRVGSPAEVARQNVAVTSGWYEIEIEVINRSSGDVTFRVLSAAGTGIIDTGWATSPTTLKRIVHANTGGVRVSIYAGGSGFVGEIGRVSLRRVLNPPLSQPTTAARPILARMPKTGRRNLLTWTEDFSSGTWAKVRSSVTTNIATAPDGTTTANKVDQASGQTTAGGVYQSIPYGTSHTQSIYAKAGEKNFLIIRDTANRDSWFNLATGSLGTINAAHTAKIEPAGNGWYRCSIAYAEGSSSPFRLFYCADTDGSTTVTDSGGIYLWHPQLEEGLIATPYQHVRSAYDVTEAGVPDAYSLVYDLADDALTTAFPQAINGDILIAGTKGSIIEPVNYVAGSTFTLGPTTYTGGTPGIMRAIGDIVGVVLIDRTLTQTERENLLRHYKGKGAKGLLVPGPELNTTGLSGWTLRDGWAVSDGVITRSGQTAGSNISKTIFSSLDTTGRSYLFKIEASARSGSFFTAVNSPGADQTQLSLGVGELQSVVVATANRSGIDITGVGNATITASSISVRELRPQEDWT